jgi:arogenate/prephenate dehydratase
VFDALDKHELEYAFLPIENSTTGSFTQIYDLLQEKNCYVIGEYLMNESHCLLVSPSVQSIQELKEIRSQNLVLDQCQKFLTQETQSRKDLDLTVSLARDPAEAAQAIQTKNLTQTGVIAGEKAAEMYGLRVLVKGVEDSPNTLTRYALISKTFTHPERHVTPKTLVAMTCKNQTGAFFKVLSCFALRDIKYESFLIKIRR